MLKNPKSIHETTFVNQYIKIQYERQLFANDASKSILRKAPNKNWIGMTSVQIKIAWTNLQ